uniref:Uncharacterized protein n=1 Tax=mine drainage metagenome TaxID=410659 RepID=E6PX28_9ZZZZ
MWSRLLGLWHLTSLDAPTAAVCWALGFAWAGGVALPLWIPVALGLGTWAIYIADRLLDAWRAITPLRERHYFHWRYRWLFIPVAVAAMTVAVKLVFADMAPAIRQRDAILALAAAAYFVAVHSGHVSRLSGGPRRWWLRLSKEAMVGLLFALVCAAPTLARARSNMASLLAPIAACFLLAWLNCWLIERWDARTTAGGWPAAALSVVVLGAALVVAFLGQPRPAALLGCVAASAMLLAWLDRIADRDASQLSALNLRAAADFVLLTPLLPLLLGHLWR